MDGYRVVDGVREVYEFHVGVFFFLISHYHFHQYICAVYPLCTYSFSFPFYSLLQGCYFHGCPTHYKGHTINLVNGHKMQDLYDRTVERMAALRRDGCRVIEMWECSWKKFLKSNEEAARDVENFRLAEALNPRMALCGGRTNAFRLYARADEKTVLRYYDIKSLYPYVQKTKDFMVGHPKVITESFGDLGTVHRRYRGFIQCTVLPPVRLLLPLLPYKTGGKLLFPLCRTCADEQVNDSCPHSAEERVLHGVFTTVELAKAVDDLGYKVISVDEVFHWDVWDKSMFADYIKTFFRIKEECTGWPRDDMTEEEKAQHIEDVWRREDVLLDHNNVQYNAGMRQVSIIFQFHHYF